MTTDLITWLRSVVEGDLAKAKAQPRGPWHVEVSARGYPQRISNAGAILIAETYDGPEFPPDTAYYIARHDPRDTIARCEAELSILGLYEGTRRVRDTIQAVTLAKGLTMRPLEARDYGDALRELAVLEAVIRFLAAGYRHRPGYLPEWAPEDTP